MKKKFTPENIQELKENQIFVFGSNMNGNHAGGAARLAVEKFGAIMGQAEGLQGKGSIRMLDCAYRTWRMGREHLSYHFS